MSFCFEFSEMRLDNNGNVWENLVIIPPSLATSNLHHFKILFSFAESLLHCQELTGIITLYLQVDYSF